MKRCKKYTFVILVIGIITFLTIHVRPMEAAENQMYGNTCGNFQNAGWAAAYKGFQYYTVYDKATFRVSLKRMDSKGNSELIITDKDIHGLQNLNVANDSIYFNNGPNALYKVDLKTKELARVGKEHERFPRPVIVGDWAYYCDSSKISRRNAVYGELWRMKLDGTKKEQLDKRIGFIHWIDNGWIYYQVDADNTSNMPAYYKMKLDGSCKTKMNFERWNYPNFEGGWIYYQDRLLNALYKVKVDGTSKTKMLVGEYTSIHVSNGWIYYVDEKDKGKLYKVRTNGKDKKLLSKDANGAIQVLGDWIYYVGSDENRYRMKIDGNNKTLLK